MSRADYMLFHSVASKVDIFLSAVCMACFLRPFLEETGRRGERRKQLSLFLTYSAVYLTGMTFPESLNGWARMVLLLVLSVLFSGYLGMGRKETALFGILFYSMKYMSVLITESLNYVVNNRLIDAAEDAGEIYRISAIDYSCAMLFRYLVFAVMLYSVGRSLSGRRLRVHAKEWVYLTLIPLAAILFGNIILRLFIVVKEDAYFRLYEQYPDFIALIPLLSLLFYAGALSAILSYREMLSLQEEKNHFYAEQRQLAAMRERMEEAEGFYEGIRRMKHEMRSHLTNIKGLAAKGEYGDMQRYLSRMDESMAVFDFGVKTGNAVTDVILSDKRKMAQKMGIQFQTEFVYPASGGYDAYDVGIIISNLLQNALEACGRMGGELPEGGRYISVSGRQKKKFFLIQVKNSFDGEILFDRNTKLPISTKEGEPFLHGMGLLNVKRESEKYMGDLDIEVKENEFCVSVLLQETESGAGG